jgi:hypothetical protein
MAELFVYLNEINNKFCVVSSFVQLEDLNPSTTPNADGVRNNDTFNGFPWRAEESGSNPTDAGLTGVPVFANPAASPAGRDVLGEAFYDDTTDVLLTTNPLGTGTVGFAAPGTYLAQRLSGVINSFEDYTISVTYCGAEGDEPDIELQAVVSNDANPDGHSSLLFYNPNNSPDQAGNTGTANSNTLRGVDSVSGAGVRNTTRAGLEGITESYCGTVQLTIRHYELFEHVGVSGLTVRLINNGAEDVYFSNFAFAVTTLPTAGAADCTEIFINEIEYNNDEIEGIEIVGPIGASAAGLKIVLIDGNSTTNSKVYYATQFGAN